MLKIRFLLKYVKSNRFLILDNGSRIWVFDGDGWVK